MHMLGTPRTMQENPGYDDVVDDVKAFLAERIEVGRRRRDRRGADLARPWDRLRQDARAQPRAAAAPRRAARAGPAAGRRNLAQELHRQGRRLRGRRAARRHDRHLGARRRRGRRRAARPRRRRGRAGDGRRRGDPRDRFAAMEAHGNGHRVERRGRAARALDLHPPRGQRRRAGGRAAARVRRLLRRARLRRGPHRSARGHGRLRPGLRHRRPRRDRAQLQTLERLAQVVGSG